MISRYNEIVRANEKEKVIMNKNEFKKELQVNVKKFGFEFHNRAYYYDVENLIIVIDCQKSNYSDSYYVNYGFYVKSLHDCFSYPQICDCDVMGRFENSMKSGLFELAMINAAKLSLKCYLENKSLG